MAVKKRPRRLRVIEIGTGLPSISQLRFELQGYVDVLLGREEVPQGVRFDLSALAEVANAYLARAREIEAFLLEREREGRSPKGGPHYKFRTGELRSFIDLFTKSWELGSRLITVATFEANGR